MFNKEDQVQIKVWNQVCRKVDSKLFTYISNKTYCQIMKSVRNEVWNRIISEVSVELHTKFEELLNE